MNDGLVSMPSLATVSVLHEKMGEPGDESM